MVIHRAGMLLACVCAALVGCTTTKYEPQSSGDCTAATNRDVVLAFYQEGLIGRHPRSAFERYTSPEFVEHKPDVPSGTREATVAYLEQLIADAPDPRWEIIRSASEGDLVFLHARFAPAPESPAYAIADIFRLRNCTIVEHWDVVGAPRQQKPNPNSRF